MGRIVQHTQRISQFLLLLLVDRQEILAEVTDQAVTIGRLEDKLSEISDNVTKLAQLVQSQLVSSRPTSPTKVSHCFDSCRHSWYFLASILCIFPFVTHSLFPTRFFNPSASFLYFCELQASTRRSSGNVAVNRGIVPTLGPLRVAPALPSGVAARVAPQSELRSRKPASVTTPATLGGPESTTSTQAPLLPPASPPTRLPILKKPTHDSDA